MYLIVLLLAWQSVLLEILVLKQVQVPFSVLFFKKNQATWSIIKMMYMGYLKWYQDNLKFSWQIHSSDITHHRPESMEECSSSFGGFCCHELLYFGWWTNFMVRLVSLQVSPYHEQWLPSSAKLMDGLMILFDNAQRCLRYFSSTVGHAW